jgi:hypothetical protein
VPRRPTTEARKNPPKWPEAIAEMVWEVVIGGFLGGVRESLMPSRSENTSLVMVFANLW